jgi:hypothetical protein
MYDNALEFGLRKDQIFYMIFVSNPGCKYRKSSVECVVVVVVIVYRIVSCHY